MVALTDLALQGPRRAGVAGRDRASGRTSRWPISSSCSSSCAAPGWWNRCAGRAAATGWRGRPTEIRMSRDPRRGGRDGERAAHRRRRRPAAASGSRAQSLTNRLWEGLSAHVYVFLHQTRLVGRGPQRARALSGGAGAVRAGRRMSRSDGAWGSRPPTRDRQAGGTGGRSGVYLDWNATAPLRPEARRGDGRGDGRRAATRRRSMPRAGRRGRSSSGRGRRWPRPSAADGAGGGLHLGCHRGGGAGAGRARSDVRGGRARRVAAWIDAGAAGRRATGGWRCASRPERAAGGQLRDRCAAGAARGRWRCVDAGAGGRARCPSPSTGPGRGWRLRLGAQDGRAEGRRRAGAARAGIEVEALHAAAAGRRWAGGREPRTSIGIAGFGAAAEAAARDLAAGVWDGVAELRNILEAALASKRRKATISVGKGAPRLPNTSCIVAPGWKGETQVMQMDLAGFAVSAGSACSSGKVRDQPGADGDGA